MAKLEKQAEEGHVNAQVRLGLKYSQAQGVGKDLTKAAQWFQKAADQENAAGMFQLGKLYLAGEGVAQETGQALHYLERAGKLGDQDAVSLLCELYYEGHDTLAADHTLALNWCQKASEYEDTASKERFESLSERLRQQEEQVRCQQECDDTYSPCKRRDVWCRIFEGTLDSETETYVHSEESRECLEEMNCSTYQPDWQSCLNRCES